MSEAIGTPLSGSFAIDQFDFASFVIDTDIIQTSTTVR
jgi:hypothetical protein